jgi:hypothetical protein
MNVPMEWSTRGLCNRDASQAFELTERLLAQVDRRLPRAVACRVAVERSHGSHEGGHGHEVEGPVHVRVEVTIPQRPPIVAVRHADEGWPGEGVVSAVHEAFRRIHAQLDSVVQRKPSRRHGSVRGMWLVR